MSRSGVVLRPWHLDDAPALVEAWSDPAIVAGSTPPDDRSLAAAEKWIEGAAAREAAGVAVDRVIDAGGMCVGEVGIAHIDAERRAALVGWWVLAGHRSAGRATSALQLFVDEVLDPAHQLGLRALLAEIAVDNLASVRVAEVAGFVTLRAGSPAQPHVYVRR